MIRNFRDRFASGLTMGTVDRIRANRIQAIDVWQADIDWRILLSSTQRARERTGHGQRRDPQKTGLLSQRLRIVDDVIAQT